MPKKTKKIKKYKSKKGTLYKYTNKKWKKASIKENKCNKYLQTKIKVNLKEYKKGKYKSYKQAIAISYSQTKKKFPKCKVIN